MQKEVEQWVPENRRREERKVKRGEERKERNRER
jgi:hypothetical protein